MTLQLIDAATAVIVSSLIAFLVWRLYVELGTRLLKGPVIQAAESITRENAK